MTRETGAVLICIGVSGLCAVLYGSHHLSQSSALNILSTVWLVAGLWVNEGFNPEFKKLRSIPLTEVFSQAKLRGLPKPSPLGLVMTTGGLIIMFAGFFL